MEKCKALLEKDDKARTDLKLPTPTFEDFKQMRGFRPYTPKEAERALFSLGIIMKNKKVAGEANTSTRRDKDRAAHKRSEKNRGGNAGRGPAGRGNFRQGPGGVRDRRSPPGGRRRKSVLQTSKSQSSLVRFCHEKVTDFVKFVELSLTSLQHPDLSTTSEISR